MYTDYCLLFYVLDRSAKLRFALQSLIPVYRLLSTVYYPMDDHQKSKEQLINELEILRQRVANLESREGDRAQAELTLRHAQDALELQAREWAAERAGNYSACHAATRFRRKCSHFPV